MFSSRSFAWPILSSEIGASFLGRPFDSTIANTTCPPALLANETTSRTNSFLPACELVGEFALVFKLAIFFYAVFYKRLKIGFGNLIQRF
jgi:hypothetical protein